MLDSRIGRARRLVDELCEKLNTVPSKTLHEKLAKKVEKALKEEDENGYTRGMNDHGG